MEVNEFRRVLSAFADEPADVEVRQGRIIAQVRDELFDVGITYSADAERQLLIVENDTKYPARSWLINRVARLPQLADRIISATASGPSAVSNFPFVRPSGLLSPDLSAGTEDKDIEVDDAVEHILAKVDGAIPGATSVMYITSDAGEGKTTIINKAARLQADRFREKKAMTLLVPIPLSGRTFLTFDDAVIAALVNKLRFNYFYFDAFIELVRMGVIVPAFDGYEEMLVEGSKGEAVSALGNLVQDLESSGTVLIAARKAFFEYISFKTQARLLDAIGDRSASFSRLALQRWNKDKFCEYGTLRGWRDPASIYKVVAERFAPDHPLLTRAVLVRRLFDVASEVADSSELGELLGTNPQDYLYAFVDAIVQREASEKWLSRVSGDLMEPLLSVEEHHRLLSLIAQEMWQSSVTSLRYDVLDAIVDIFAEEKRKPAAAIRQIRERIRQHSLLAVDSTRGQAIAFDHEDFQNFYVGELLGLLVAAASRSEVQALLGITTLPRIAVEQAVQHLMRSSKNFSEALALVSTINGTEVGFSFCKENCGTLAIRFVELLSSSSESLAMHGFLLPAGALVGRVLARISFQNCHFQPTSLDLTGVEKVEFIDCTFERVEIRGDTACAAYRFERCEIDSLLLLDQDSQLFDPESISAALRGVGATIDDGRQQSLLSSVKEIDSRVKIFERFLRAFVKRTHIDEDMIRTRLGKVGSPIFFAEMLQPLLDAGVLEKATWKGRGVQDRYKLAVRLAEIDSALADSRGDFDHLMEKLGGH
jgi:hypothetical protein